MPMRASVESDLDGWLDREEIAVVSAYLPSDLAVPVHRNEHVDVAEVEFG